MDEPDEALVEKMTRGDREALGELHRRHAGRLSGLIRAVVRDDVGTEDVVQEVFLEAWRKCASFDRDRGTVGAWLSVRAKSRALDRVRRQSRKRETDLEQAVPVGQTSIFEDGLHLPRAFSAVTAQERDVVWLGYYEGLSSSEIAERLSIPIGTVKSRTRSALKKMRSFYEGEQS